MSKHFFKNCILALLFGAIYCGIELIWRGYTDWSMAVVGGVAGVLIGLLNERPSYNKKSILLQCVVGMGIVTVFEGLSGYVLNIKLGLNIWDYSNMPGQFFFGQCCVPYCILWFFLSGAAIFLDDWLRWLLWDEPKKKYRWI